MRRVAFVILACTTLSERAASHKQLGKLPRAMFSPQRFGFRLPQAAALVFYVSGPMERAEMEVQVLWEMFNKSLLAAVRH